jgi:hypothetical protein
MIYGAIKNEVAAVASSRKPPLLCIMRANPGFVLAPL